jgi:hypothetical protein
MSGAQRRAFGGNSIFVLFSPNDEGETASTHPKLNNGLFTLASTPLLALFFGLVPCLLAVCQDLAVAETAIFIKLAESPVHF